MKQIALRTPTQVSSTLSGHFSGNLLRAPVALLESLITWQDHAEERAALRRLTDHQLKDMGLTRAEVEAMARRSDWSRGF